MNPRLAEVERIAGEALDVNGDRRAAFIERACAGDEALRGEVEAWLRAHAAAGSFLEVPILADASRPGLNGGAAMARRWSRIRSRGSG